MYRRAVKTAAAKSARVTERDERFREAQGRGVLEIWQALFFSVDTDDSVNQNSLHDLHHDHTHNILSRAGPQPARFLFVRS